jgi:WD40 repeat protein
LQTQVCRAAYGVIGTDPTKVLFASGGRDRLVHVHDGTKGYAAVAKRWIIIRGPLQFTTNGKNLISCGADKTIVFSDVSGDGKLARYNSVPFTGGKIYDMTITMMNGSLR